MEAERWRRIEKLYQAALAQPPEKRLAFLLQACPDDPQLRGEVESLLAQKADSFLESAPVSAIKALSPGAMLGNFELVELLGRGGMGEVWRAHDPRLKRDVAIKVLPAAFAGDRDRIARFEHEARAASALNHPNIVAIYDIGHEDGKYWIVSELVDGESLRALIAHGPLSPAKATNIAIQIASGLAAAHAAGIVHRDLKPGNVMLHRDGRVKLVDFGLAKRVRAGTEGTTVTNSGVVMGTAGYMAPEQVRGEEVDHRADIFSFGVVLYEMLSGKQAFRGNSSVELMHAILKDEPPDLPPVTPAALDRFVRRCLEKDPARRFQTAADLGFAFEATPTARRSRAKWPIAAALAVAAAVGVAYWLLRPLPPPRVIRMTQITHEGHLTESTICPLLSDSSRLFYGPPGNPPAYQVSVKGGESDPLPLQTRQAGYLMDVSRERAEFLVCRPVNDGCELWAEPMFSGSPRRLGGILASAFASWSPDGRQLAYQSEKSVHLADRDGNEIRTLATFGGYADDLRWSPDGSRIRVAASAGAGKPARIWEIRPDGAGLHQVLPNWKPSSTVWQGAWTPDGRYFVFVADERLCIVREKSGWLKPGGEPIELDTGVLKVQYPLPSPDGKRLFFEGWHQDHNEFLRYDFKTGRASVELPGISGTWLEYSRDRKWVTYVTVPEGTVFRAAADGSQRLQLSWPPMSALEPRWSPDGKEIAFAASMPGQSNRIYIVPFDGGTPRQVSNGEGGPLGEGDPSWSPNGESLAFSTDGFQEKPDRTFIQVLDLKTKRVARLPGSEGMWSPRWSPNGDFVAGVSEPGGKLMLDELRTHTQTQLVPHAACPSWSSDSRFLFFSRDSSWWRVRIRDRKVEPVGSLKNIELADWGWWFALAPNDSLVVARYVGAGDIYALDWELP